jgi:hypothetical protein
MPAITSYDETSATAKAFRALNKFGMNLADFAALTTSTSFSAFGNGTGYTVGNWVSDGVFASVAAAQVVYPIIQDGNDHVDWVLLQSAVDFLIHDAIGDAKGTTKRKLLIPAGSYLINRTLHVGYGTMGTPPAGMNGNKYVSITIEGEGRQVDTSGNGMTGTSIITENYTYPGIVLSLYQAAQLRGFTLQGPLSSWMSNNLPLHDSDVWDRAAWRDPAITDDEHYIGGDRVHIGIGFDLYSDATAAAAYPARILPSYYGGGTSTAVSATVGGTTVEIEDVSVTGYVIGIGRPHGDSNGEFYRIRDVDISNGVHGFVSGHSQARNNSLVNVNFQSMHTAIANTGGLRTNANHHGTYQNIHFGACFQLYEHTNPGWSGPIVFNDCYAESFYRIGTGGSLKLHGGFYSFLEQVGSDGVPYNHFEFVRLVLDNTYCTGLRHGLVGDADATSGNLLEIINGTNIVYGQESVLSALDDVTEANVVNGLAYMQGILHGAGMDRRLLFSSSDVSFVGRGNNLRYGDIRSEQTFLDQHFTYFYSQHPLGTYPAPSGSAEMQGSVHHFPVPKISQWQLSVTVSSRSGFDLTCPRTSIGDIEADLGDIFAMKPDDTDPTLEKWTYFIVVGISGSDMTLRQLNNFNSTSATDYSTNGFYQITTTTYNAQYICTRIRQNTKLWVGDVTAGSAVISNVRPAFQFGTTDQFTDAQFQMSAGDYFLHQEIERSLSTGGVKVHNLVSSIDYTANTITLTENFNITRNAYPIVFYVKVFNA